jgi:hypothetical protein
MGGKCTNVESEGTYLTGDVYHIFIKVSQQLLWVGSCVARVKIKVSVKPNRIIFV